MIIQLKIQNATLDEKEKLRVKNSIDGRLKMVPKPVIIFENSNVRTTLVNSYNLDYDGSMLMRDYIDSSKKTDNYIDTSNIILIRSEQTIKHSITRHELSKMVDTYFFTKNPHQSIGNVHILGNRFSPTKVYVANKFEVEVYSKDRFDESKGIVIFHDDRIANFDILYRIFTKGIVYLINVNKIEEDRSDMPFFNPDHNSILSKPYIQNGWFLGSEEKTGIVRGAIINDIILSVRKSVQISFTVDAPVILKINGMDVLLDGNTLHYLTNRH